MYEGCPNRQFFANMLPVLSQVCVSMLVLESLCFLAVKSYSTIFTFLELISTALSVSHTLIEFYINTYLSFFDQKGGGGGGCISV